MKLLIAVIVNKDMNDIQMRMEANNTKVPTIKNIVPFLSFLRGTFKHYFIENSSNKQNSICKN